ncbi:MAG: hypothetical protein Q8N59_01255 [bacterium]|nr:hypothetical protein [bacterium]
MEPIKLTEYGDVLTVDPYVVVAIDDNTELHEFKGGWQGRIGKHGHGWNDCTREIEIKKITELYNVIFCKGCFLRIVIPSTVKTYGDLRSFLKKFNP